jgi:catechol 2,3-dioxygenase-like lactoylglutathione lyase family enzyme
MEPQLFAGIPVADLPTSVAWYERFFGREPDMRPNDTEACWQWADGRWVYVIVDADRAGGGLVTLMADNLDGVVADLADRGLVVGPLEDMAPGTRKTVIRDPDGNELGLGEAPG